MSAQPAALYGPPVGGHDENVPTSLRVMLAQGALLLAGLLAGAESALIARRTPGVLRRLLNSGHSVDVAGRMAPCRRCRPPAQGRETSGLELSWGRLPWPGS